MWPNPQQTADLITFTGEILNSKTLFFGQCSWWGHRHVLWWTSVLFISLFESVFLFLLVNKSLFFYPSIFPMFKLRLHGSIKMPLLIEKPTFDNACPKTLWYLSISAPIGQFSFINAINVLLKTCWASTEATELRTILLSQLEKEELNRCMPALIYLLFQ